MKSCIALRTTVDRSNSAGRPIASWNHRKHDTGRVSGAVKHRLVRNSYLFFVRQISSCIEISAKPGKITAGNLNSYPMSCPKYVACDPRIDGDWVNLPRPGQLRRFETFPVSQPEHAVTEISCMPVWKDVHQFCCEVG